MFILSFVLWLVFCLLLTGWKYYEHHHFVLEDAEGAEEEAHMFEDETVKNAGLVGDAETFDDNEEVHTPSDLEEPLLDGSAQVPRKTYFESVYFNRVSFRSGTSSVDEDLTPREIYKNISALEEADVKWYQRIWQFLPFQPAWNLFVMGTLTTFGCCRKDSAFSSMSWFKKSMFVLSRVLKIGINLLALYVAIVACG